MIPLKNFVLMGEVKEDLKTESGLILTQSVTAGLKPGKILAIGPDVEGVKVGQHVICNWKASVAVDVEGIMCVLLRDEEIMAITKDVE